MSEEPKSKSFYEVSFDAPPEYQTSGGQILAKSADQDTQIKSEMSLEHDGGFIIDHCFDQLFGRDMKFEYEKNHGFDAQLKFKMRGKGVEDF